MAWNPQGGGQGPWGRGPAGPQPPDIEELLRRGQDRVRRILPGGAFPMHPHRDFEIITYVRRGAVTHEDSMGNKGRTAAVGVRVGF